MVKANAFLLFFAVYAVAATEEINEAHFVMQDDDEDTQRVRETKPCPHRANHFN